MTPQPRNTATLAADLADLDAADRATALDSSCSASNAILDLQGTDVWYQLPIEARRAICAARVHMRRAADALD
jgi:hypothetical protein